MEDINRSGPTEERREELRLLMKKLKESGKLGTTGMMSDMNEGGALEGSRSQTVVAPPAPPAPVPPSPPPPAPPSPPPITAEAVEAAVQPTDAADAPAVPSDELLEDGLPKSSGSVGGRWVPPEDPQKPIAPDAVVERFDVKKCDPRGGAPIAAPGRAAVGAQI